MRGIARMVSTYILIFSIIMFLPPSLLTALVAALPSSLKQNFRHNPCSPAPLCCTCHTYLEECLWWYPSRAKRSFDPLRGTMILQQLAAFRYTFDYSGIHCRYLRTLITACSLRQAVCCTAHHFRHPLTCLWLLHILVHTLIALFTNTESIQMFIPLSLPLR